MQQLSSVNQNGRLAFFSKHKQHPGSVASARWAEGTVWYGTAIQFYKNAVQRFYCSAAGKKGKTTWSRESQTSKRKLQQTANQRLPLLFCNWVTAEETLEQRQLIAQLETLTSSPHYSVHVSCFTTPMIFIWWSSFSCSDITQCHTYPNFRKNTIWN